MMLPPRFAERMRLLLGEEYPAFFATLCAPLSVRGLRVNTLKADPAAFSFSFPLPLSPVPFSPDGFSFEDDGFKAGSDPLHHAGAYYVQEPSALSAVTVLAPKKGERVLDLCAAPGGKSTQIAAALDGTGLLWCNEYVPARAAVLRQNLERCGVRNAFVSAGDTAVLSKRFPAFFDAVLADVPCSGEGMFRKEPEAIPNWSEENIALCAERGQEILHNAARCVRPGGRLVLSTCTFAPEENEWAVVRFLQSHPAFTLEKIDVPFGREGFDADRIAPFSPLAGLLAGDIPLSFCRRVLPADGGEGHFVALFRRAVSDTDAETPLFHFPAPDAGALSAESLYHDCFTDTPAGRFVTFHETVHLLPPVLPALGGLHLLYAGIPVATLHEGRVLRAEPTHALFSCARAENCRHLLDLYPDDPSLLAFLRGEELAVQAENGYTAVAVCGAVTGFGKETAGKLKNHYPKGLRLLN